MAVTVEYLSADQIRTRLGCPGQGCACRRGRNTHCPGPSHANGDRTPSLTVDQGDGGPLVNCKGGCSQEQVISALQERDLWPRREQDGARRVTRIVATYDYRDRHGKLAFQVVRLHPKDFRQRRPDGAGGWIWKKGDTSILYRLPELLAASRGEVVYLCEGEKDTDRLTSLGLVATTRAEGAGKWTDANSLWLEGRRVAILRDHDQAGTLDADRKLRSLQPVAAGASVLDLGLAKDGEDVSDWLDAGHTADELRALAEAALAMAPTATHHERPDTMVAFPTDVLPPSLRALVLSAASSLRVPPEFMGVPLIVLSGAVIGNSWELELKKGWKEGPNLYAAVVADPGSKKTPALKVAMRPLFAVQRRLHAEYAAGRVAYEADLAAWEALSKKEKGLAVKPTEPAYKHVYTTDATTEALAEMLASSKGLALVRDELVGWVRSMDVYHSGGKGADRQAYLSMWARSTIKIDRKSRPDPILVDLPCLSVVGGIQPDLLPDLVERGARDDGFVDRLLWAYPDLEDDRWTDEGVDEAAVAAADRLFEGLYELGGLTLPNGESAPRVARLAADAHPLWVEWHNAHSDEARSDALQMSLRGPWAKFHGQAARLILLLHVLRAVDAEGRVPAIVSRETVAGALDLVEFFKDHARAALGELRTPRSELDERILRALRERGPCTTRTLQRDVLRGNVKVDRLRAALELLAEQGRVVAEQRPAGGKGGRPSEVWSIVESADEPKGRKRGGFVVSA